MSLRLIDRWLHPSRTALLLLTTVLLWGGQLLVLLGMLQFIRIYLNHSIQGELKETLIEFVSDNEGLIHSPEAYSALFDENSLRGLNFVRIIRNDEQFLYSSSADMALSFRDLAELDPLKSGSWLPLFRNSLEDQSLWNVASAPLSDKLLVQVGLRDQYLHRMYEHLVVLFWWGAIPTFVFAALAAYIGYRFSLFPINYLAERLRAADTEGDRGIDVPPTDSKELQQIYQRLNSIIIQNRQLVKEMQESLDNVAHDLRTPMTRLRSVAEFGLQAGSDPERLRESLSDCLEESDRVLSMLKIMMSVAEAESGTLELEMSTFNLLQSILEVVELYEYSAEEEEVEIIIELDEALWIRGDRTRLSQVWANLLDNAIKYNKPKGWVKISASHYQETVTISFQDCGSGISSHEQNRIWERLYRGDRSRTRQGLGLGLNYVKGVIEAHGGAVWVKSSLNETTTFFVELDGCVRIESSHAAQ